MKKSHDDVVTIDLFKNKVNTYMKKDWPQIFKAYCYAEKHHKGQKRE